MGTSEDKENGHYMQKDPQSFKIKLKIFMSIYCGVRVSLGTVSLVGWNRPPSPKVKKQN